MIRLGYARNSQRWKLRAALLIIASLMVTGYLGAKWPAWRANAQMRYWAARCANYSKPSDFVVFDEDESRSAALLASGRGYSRDPFMSGAACYIPAEWWHVAGLSDCRATIFLHERHGTTGSPFLTWCSVGCVNGGVMKLSEARQIYFLAGPAPRPVTTADGWTGSSMTFTPLVLILRPDDRLRVFAGQPDPAAGDQFSFIVEVNGVRDTVAARVGPNGSVTFTTHVGQTYSLGCTYWSFDKDHKIFETTNAPSKSTMPANDVPGK